MALHSGEGLAIDALAGRSADGRYLLCERRDRRLLVDAETGKVTDYGPISGVALSAFCDSDSPRLALTRREKLIEVLDVVKERSLARTSWPKGKPHGLWMASNGELLFASVVDQDTDGDGELCAGESYAIRKTDVRAAPFPIRPHRWISGDTPSVFLKALDGGAAWRRIEGEVHAIPGGCIAIEAERITLHRAAGAEVLISAPRAFRVLSLSRRWGTLLLRLPGKEQHRLAVWTPAGGLRELSPGALKPQVDPSKHRPNMISPREATRVLRLPTEEGDLWLDLKTGSTITATQTVLAYHEGWILGQFDTPDGVPSGTVRYYRQELATGERIPLAKASTPAARRLEGPWVRLRDGADFDWMRDATAKPQQGRIVALGTSPYALVREDSGPREASFVSRELPRSSFRWLPVR